MADILRQVKRGGPIVPLYATTLAGIEALESLDRDNLGVVAVMTRKALVHVDHVDAVVDDLVRDHGVEVADIWQV